MRASALAWLIATAAPDEASPLADASEPAITERVIVRVAGPDRVSDAILETTHELLGPLPLALEVTKIEAVDPNTVVWGDLCGAFAEIWVDLTRGDEATIFVVDAQHRVLVRPMPLGPHVDIVREEIGLVLQAAVEALLAGDEIGFEAAQVGERLGLEKPGLDPESTPQPERETDPGAPAARLHSTVSVGYRVAVWSSVIAPLHGPTVEAALGRGRGRRWLGATLEAGYHVPVLLLFERLRVNLSGPRIRVGAQLVERVRPSLALVTRAGLGLDLLFVRSTARVEGGQPAPDQLDVTPTVDLGFAPWWVRGERHDLRVGLLAGAEVALRRIRYYTRGEEEVIRPWPVRVVFAVRIGWGSARL